MAQAQKVRYIDRVSRSVMATSNYSLRPKSRKSYKELAEFSLPRPKRADKNRLYPVEVVEEEEDQVKVHYVGYSRTWDEWKSRDDVVDLHPRDKRDDALQLEKYTPPDYHWELAHAIKASLSSSRKVGPDVRIELPFDLLIFNGGLKQVGSFLRTYRNNDLYGIQDYDNLVPLLGKKWYIRGISEQLDFCAVLKDTVVFHLYRKAPIKDYITGELLCGGACVSFCKI